MQELNEQEKYLVVGGETTDNGQRTDTIEDGVVDRSCSYKDKIGVGVLGFSIGMLIVLTPVGVMQCMCGCCCRGMRTIFTGRAG